MNKRWLIILLLISVAFNLAMVGSFLYLRFGRPHPPYHHRLPPPGPHPGFRDFGERWKMMDDDSTRVLRDNFQEAKRELMLELAKDPIDEAKINQIIDCSIEAQCALERGLGNKMIEFRKTMNAEEANQHFSRRLEDMQNRKDRTRRRPR